MIALRCAAIARSRSPHRRRTRPVVDARRPAWRTGIVSFLRGHDTIDESVRGSSASSRSPRRSPRFSDGRGQGREVRAARSPGSGGAAARVFARGPRRCGAARWSSRRCSPSARSEWCASTSPRSANDAPGRRTARRRAARGRVARWPSRSSRAARRSRTTRRARSCKASPMARRRSRSRWCSRCRAGRRGSRTPSAIWSSSRFRCRAFASASSCGGASCPRRWRRPRTSRPSRPRYAFTRLDDHARRPPRRSEPRRLRDPNQPRNPARRARRRRAPHVHPPPRRHGATHPHRVLVG